MPGFRLTAEQKEHYARLAEEKRDRSRIKEAAKKLKASGFQMDKLQQTIKNLTGKNPRR